jgi:hypothetical protein
MRHGLVGGPTAGLTSIWGAHPQTWMEAGSLAVVVGFTAALLTVSTRVFRTPALP